VAAANAGWAALSAAQRELSFASLARRPDLWPYQIRLAVPIELSGAPALRPGDPVLLLGYERNQLIVRIQKSGIAFNVEPENTDLLAQARSFLANRDGAPGRLLEELAGKLVDPITGRPVQLDPAVRPKHVVLYMGAGWCAPCKVFAPKLVQAMKDKASKPGDLALVYLSGDKTPAEAKRYVTGLGISWPMLPFTKRDQIPAFQSLFGNTIPQLVVTDRHGTVVVDSAKVGYDRALAQLRELL
jgi:thiol-disulfide isomerase/thioredoxin